MKTNGTLGLLKLLAGLVVCAGFSAGAQLAVDEPPSPGSGGAFTHAVDGTVFTFMSSAFTGSFPPCYVDGNEIIACQFRNESDEDWLSLEVLIAPGDEPIGCAALDSYNTCSSEQGTDILPSRLIFSGGTGTPIGEIVAFKGSGWTVQATFVVTANGANTPEPGSVMLVVLGISVLYVLRRRAVANFLR